MHLHILGIGGTFMAGLARLAVESGHRVTGSDANLYPPMSTQLESLGVEVHEGYSAAALAPAPDLVVVGNAVSRGNPAVEHVLSAGLDYVSGPAWLKDNVLQGRHVIAVAGTHGKTTVASLVSWMLDHAGFAPGFLVGGVVENFGLSARVGAGGLFVIEADEYDTAFFDKRSKFIHYGPRTLIVNNIEFDHADIFTDLEAIQTQFHHLIRTLPREALILRRYPDAAVDAVLEMGCWSRTTTFGRDAACAWRLRFDSNVPESIAISAPDGAEVQAATPLLGEHNAWNVLAAVCAVSDAGLSCEKALAALPSFKNVKRRLELKGIRRGVRVFDDFAHHPTAIAATIEALRSSSAGGRIIAVMEPRSNTMRMGVHRESLAGALEHADEVAVFAAEKFDWDIDRALAVLPRCRVYRNIHALAGDVVSLARTGDQILIMSNGAFDNIHDRILEGLDETT
jgi:UDP-N-acetylmuramate: L-alanyl-gamma-D-glutamyl-meso-diaminopimelate ligase